MVHAGLPRAFIVSLAVLALFGCPAANDENISNGDTYEGTWQFVDDTVRMEKVVLTISGSSWEIEFFTYPGPTLSQRIIGTVTADGSRFDVEVSEYNDTIFGTLAPGEPDFDLVMDDYESFGYGDGVDSIYYDYNLSGNLLTITLDIYSYDMVRQ